MTRWSGDNEIKFTSPQPQRAQGHDAGGFVDVGRLEQRPARPVRLQGLARPGIELDARHRRQAAGFKTDVKAAGAAE
ncbi:hypothetical protein A5690_07070 [Mycobacterium intracellulare]|nr:hypothetical protein A5690_07070 [Mycobacterium intracellulare]